MPTQWHTAVAPPLPPGCCLASANLLGVKSALPALAASAMGDCLSCTTQRTSATPQSSASGAALCAGEDPGGGWPTKQGCGVRDRHWTMKAWSGPDTRPMAGSQLPPTVASIAQLASAQPDAARMLAVCSQGMHINRLRSTLNPPMDCRRAVRQVEVQPDTTLDQRARQALPDMHARRERGVQRVGVVGTLIAGPRGGSALLLLGAFSIARCWGATCSWLGWAWLGLAWLGLAGLGWAGGHTHWLALQVKLLGPGGTHPACVFSARDPAAPHPIL